MIRATRGSSSATGGPGTVEAGSSKANGSALGGWCIGGGMACADSTSQRCPHLEQPALPVQPSGTVSDTPQEGQENLTTFPRTQEDYFSLRFPLFWLASRL